MIFSNDDTKFPNCREGDLIRFHRIKIDFRTDGSVKYWQGVMDMNAKYQSFVVFDGNVTITNNEESVKHASSEKYTFDDKVDHYFIKYLKENCRLWLEVTNP